MQLVLRADTAQGDIVLVPAVEQSAIVPLPAGVPVQPELVPAPAQQEAAPWPVVKPLGAYRKVHAKAVYRVPPIPKTWGAL